MPSTFDSRRASPAQGFTLVELMVTVAVVGILATVAVPSMTGFVNTSRLAGASEELTASLQMAKSEAVRRNRPVTVCGGQDGSDDCTGSTSWDQIIVRHDEGDGDDPAVIRRFEFPGAVDVQSSVDEIVFRPSGTVNAQQTLTACIPTANPPLNVREVTLMVGGGVATIKKSGGGAC